MKKGHIVALLVVIAIALLGILFFVGKDYIDEWLIQRRIHQEYVQSEYYSQDHPEEGGSSSTTSTPATTSKTDNEITAHDYEGLWESTISDDSFNLEADGNYALYLYMESYDQMLGMDGLYINIIQRETENSMGIGTDEYGSVFKFDSTSTSKPTLNIDFTDGYSMTFRMR